MTTTVESLAAKQEKHPNFNGIVGTPDVVLARLQEYTAVGSQYVTFNLADSADIAGIQLLGATVLPQVAQQFS
jgi:alkanesulfonate monooxygenase SsuD/methylene tetrahydromethanopterin reductase-like flavin-dependent oxidoreductase (luciferase family)